MGGIKNKGVNQKAATAQAKKDEAAAQQAARKAQEDERLAAQEWKQGANLRKLDKESAAAMKADEAARKKREKQELLAQEEAGMPSKVKVGGGAAKKKKKPQNDLALLEDALQKGAEKKIKSKKEELQKREQEQKAKIESSTQQQLDPLLANTEQQIGNLADETGRKANIARMQEDAGASGIDAALGSLGISSAVGAGGSELKSAKALYNAFEHQMLPIVKEEYPGLRLTQYKEKVWNLWKKSPDNPANQLPS